MELGKKIRVARLEAGLSQKALCGDEITRNMLSLIENGTAKPSMKTLQYLANRLGKSVSYFLEEEAVLSPNQTVMEQARQYFDAGQYLQAAQALTDYRQPDPVYDRERQLLDGLIQLEMVEQAIGSGRWVYARELLNRMPLPEGYCAESLRRRQLLLLGKAGSRKVSCQLPSVDEELLLRAREAFEEKRILRAQQLLDAAEDQAAPEWNLLRGQVYLAQCQYQEAAECLHKAENQYPKETWFRLEHCYRELEDYKRAYEYACKQK